MKRARLWRSAASRTRREEQSSFGEILRDVHGATPYLELSSREALLEIEEAALELVQRVERALLIALGRQAQRVPPMRWRGPSPPSPSSSLPASCPTGRGRAGSSSTARCTSPSCSPRCRSLFSSCPRPSTVPPRAPAGGARSRREIVVGSLGLLVARVTSPKHSKRKPSAAARWPARPTARR